MKVLIVKNIPAEGPGTIEDYLKDRGLPYRIVEFSEGETVTDVGEYSHLVIMGGPMAVYEMDKYTYLKTEAELIDNFIKSGRSVLGICLGAQMIAHVLGARVYPGGIKEIGWYRVEITPEGMEDEVFSTLSMGYRPHADVFQWHGDTFDLPWNAVRMSTSEVYQDQAFRYGEKTYALQFHIEVTPEIIEEWFRDEEEFDLEDMLVQTRRIFPEYRKRAMNFYKKFFS